MYHSIVRAKVRSAFATANRGDWSEVLAAFSPRLEHVFHGEHALGGRRTKPETIRAWYERLARVFPDLQFELHRVDVTGWPWATNVAVEWTDRFGVGEGRGQNHGVHLLRFEWGRITKLDIYCDTQKLERVLAHKAQLGIGEALAAPIADG
jgi:ketosteroid isomerase-like protein